MMPEGSHITGKPPPALIAALGLAALVPAVGVLWFMSVAMRNERLAVQERFTAVYVNHLNAAQQRVTAFVRERQAALLAHAGAPPPAAFAAMVRARLADAVVVNDSAGRVLYPSGAVTTGGATPSSENVEWRRAEQLEFQRGDWAGAAEIYGRIAASTREATPRARAMLAQAVCWLKGGEQKRALARLAELVGDASLAGAASEQGTLIVPHAQLLLLQRGAPGLAELTARLNNYSGPALPASQRRFLMTEALALAPAPDLFPTLAAENLAADYLERDPPAPIDDRFQATSLAGVWRLASEDRHVVALWREERLRAELAAHLGRLVLPDVRIRVLAPDEVTTTLKMPVPAQDAGEFLPGWRLALEFRAGDPLAGAAARQARFYLWMGVGLVAIIGALALMIARIVSAQVRLARLKDDLVSTVSHELKTPVASMRVLLDTLSAGRNRDEAHLQRYLHLATRENMRLSQLVENFLVFSRLERQQQPFRFAALSPRDLARAAVDTLGEKFTGPACQLTLTLSADLPAIRGDAEALTTVLLNLLDNAYKYTGAEKHIELRGYSEGEHVVLAVADNGIGIAREERQRIFDRFYQVDQGLTRQRGGCGLGLSIVLSIVRAHGGAVDVLSEPGRGSVFRVKIPTAVVTGERTPNARVIFNS